MAEAWFGTLTAFLGDKYGLRVEVGLSPRDVSAAVEYANLRNGTIQLSAVRSEEQQGFVLAHVFGHLVQYLDSDRYAPLISKVETPPPIHFEPEDERAYLDYEMEAFGWGEVLMRACARVPAELFNRYRAFAAVDFRTYLSYLKTGVQTDPDSFQTMLRTEARKPLAPMWDCAAMRLPGSLVTNDVSISVL